MVVSMKWRRVLSVNRGQHGSIKEVEKDLICK